VGQWNVGGIRGVAGMGVGGGVGGEEDRKEVTSDRQRGSETKRQKGDGKF
jgi:hypothetical protein